LSSKSSDRAILLLSCPDTTGIVAEVSHFVFTYGGNIIDSHQHSDRESGTFFMRLEWSLENFTLPKKKLAQAFDAIAHKFSMDYRIEYSDQMKRMAIMVSKTDHCLYDLILRNKEGETHANISLIMSNHEDCRSIADFFDIPFYYVPVTKETKKEAEAEQLRILEENDISLIVLARYMQILSAEFVDNFPNQIINIHHSFLPAFIGAKPYHQAFERGVKLIGATSHYVTSDLDQGPIIEQDVTRVSHKDGVHDLVMKGRNLEKLVLSSAVKLDLEHRILTFGNKTIVFA
jgi:formyltetrahydrofolate deformylase